MHKAGAASLSRVRSLVDETISEYIKLMVFYQ